MVEKQIFHPYPAVFAAQLPIGIDHQLFAVGIS